MSIPFTQFLRPYGHRTPTTIDMDPETEAMANALITAGMKFEIEELVNGKISMECVNRAIEDGAPGFLLSNAVCSNGPPVVAAVRDLVAKAHAQRFYTRGEE